MSKVSRRRFEISCISQGINSEKFDRQSLVQWVTEERNFWEHKSFLDTEIRLHSNSRFRDFRLTEKYREAWEKVLRDLEANDAHSGSLAKLMDAASKLEIILGHGTVGRQIEALFNEDNADIAQRIALFNSTHLINLRENEELYQTFASFRASSVYNPRFQAEQDIATAQDALRLATQTNKDLSEALETSQKYLAERRKEIDDLAHLYRQKLLIEGPAEHWSRTAVRGRKLAIASFATFALMLALPTALIYFKWTAISAYIDHIVDTTKGSLSLAGIVVFTIPIFGYGWLLKHVSRVFTQSLAISADAEHRQVLAVTFLGLAQNSSVGMTEQDRALILNALFRPIASGPQDEGPPSGLLELIKK